MMDSTSIKIFIMDDTGMKIFIILELIFCFVLLIFVLKSLLKGRELQREEEKYVYVCNSCLEELESFERFHGSCQKCQCSQKMDNSWYHKKKRNT